VELATLTEQVSFKEAGNLGMVDFFMFICVCEYTYICNMYV